MSDLLKLWTSKIHRSPPPERSGMATVTQLPPGTRIVPDERTQVVQYVDPNDPTRPRRDPATGNTLVAPRPGERLVAVGDGAFHYNRPPTLLEMLTSRFR